MSQSHGVRIQLCGDRWQVGSGELRSHQLQREEGDSEEVLPKQEHGEQQDGPHPCEDGHNAQGLQVRNPDVCAEEGAEGEQKVFCGGQGQADVGRTLL